MSLHLQTKKQITLTWTSTSSTEDKREEIKSINRKKTAYGLYGTITYVAIQYAYVYTTVVLYIRLHTLPIVPTQEGRTESG